MKKHSSQGILITPEELQRIQIFVAQSLKSSSRPRIKEKPKIESYQFKPEINKQSTMLQRSINDLYRWNHNKKQKIQQIYDDEVQFYIILKSREFYTNANRLTHEITQPSVFDRLYQVRKSHETISSQSKRNTSNSRPYYTKNMTTSMYQEYKQQYESAKSKSKTYATDSKCENSQQKSINQPYYDSDQLPLASEDPLKGIPPIKQYVDLSDQVESSMNEPDSPAKSPLHQKDIDVMVERLNNWQAKKQQRELELQDEIAENLPTPKQINQNREPSFGNPSFTQMQQSQSKSYSNMFLPHVRIGK